MNDTQRQEESAKKVLQQLNGGLAGVTDFKMVEFPEGVFWFAVLFPTNLWEASPSIKNIRELKRKIDKTQTPK